MLINSLRVGHVFFLLLFGITSSGCESPKLSQPNWKPSYGYVPDSETAKKVAEAVWIRIYGKGVSENKPFKVFLKDSSIWIVEGTLSSDDIGGTPYAEIQKSDGKILKISHTK